MGEPNKKEDENNKKKIIDVSEQFDDQSGASEQKESAGNNRTFYKDVVFYRDADAETRARMDQLIAQIDTDNILSIISFGSEPVEEMAEVAEKILHKAQSSGQVVTDLKGLAAKMNVFKHGETGNLVKRYTRQTAWLMAGGARKAMLTPLRLVGGVADKMGMSKFRQQNLMVRSDDIRISVGKSIMEGNNILDRLEKGGKKIPGLLSDIQELGQARLMAYSEMGLYIGAIIEKTERFQSEFETLQQQMQNNPTAEVQDQYENAKMAMEMLMQRTRDLYTNHQASLTSLYTLTKMKSALGTIHGKIISHRKNSSAQWKLLQADNLITANTADLARTVKAADDFGMKVLESTIKTREAVSDAMRKSQGQGTLDPVKVAQLIEQEAKRVAKDQADYDKQIEDIGKHMTALSQAGNKMRQALAESEMARANPERFLEQMKKLRLAEKVGGESANDNKETKKIEGPKDKPSNGKNWQDFGPG